MRRVVPAGRGRLPHLEGRDRFTGVLIFQPWLPQRRDEMLIIGNNCDIANIAV
jgi:hypothetical protein